MIEHINARLIRWADWAARSNRAVGLGYSPCTIIRLMKGEFRCTFNRNDPMINDEAMNTERAVIKLPDELRKVVVVYYLKSGTVEQKARDCRCCRDTLYARLHHAHQRIDELLAMPRRERVSPKACIFSGTY
jgi:DNA-directed RNA polymerase specialized sigma24 family protein